MNTCLTDYNKLKPVICLVNEDRENSKFEDLKHFTELSWNLYSNRLGDKSTEFYRAGANEFDLNNNQIIEKVIEMDMPKKISLSVTSDKSLHYTFMFNDFTLFIETFLTLESENDTYIEFFKNDEVILAGKYDIESGLENIINTYKKNGGYINFPSNNYISNLLDACETE